MRKLTNDELDRLSVSDFRQTAKAPCAWVLDDVRSMHNVGSVFRTADAFLIEKLYLCGITGQPPHREIHKTALGATDTVAWEYAPAVVPLLHQLRAAGYSLVAVEQADQSTPLSAFRPLPGIRYCFIFGNEVVGVHADAVALADACVEIPQLGTKHSLNVAVSAGIVGWDFLSKLQY